MRRPSHLRFRSTGIALILVIVALALIALLVVAFLTMVSVERRASNAYADGVSVQTLSDSTANLVIGQIRQATERLGTTKSWASQPGAIRTFGINIESGGRAALDNVYKLYSSAAMVVGNPFDADGEVPPEDWATQIARYTDINEPVSDGAPTPTLRYPILTPPVPDEIEGFQIQDAPGATTQQPAPMPVEWLYQLKDGRTVAPTVSNGKKADFDPSVVTKDNPIVGRIAFWTDDESAKVNINTAAEGVFWDQPYGNTKIERGLTADIVDKPTGSGSLGYAASIPVRNEFTRYSGHPARTSLSAIFNHWIPITLPAAKTEYTDYLTALEDYYRLTPRVAFGGTKGGTIYSSDTQPLASDSDRLYASVDELFFGTKITGDLSDATARRVPNQTALDIDVLAKTKFLLTASSRSPEVNLFNKPRIALWPQNLDKKSRNVVDGVIAFASTTGRNSTTQTTNERPYYFQRARVYGYDSKDNIKGGSSAESPKEDFDKVERNQQLYKYLQQLTRNPVPGYGKSFRDKYGADDCDQLSTEITDYLRSYVNLTSLGLQPKYRYDSQSGGDSWVAPLLVNQDGKKTKGFGRFPTLTEAALVFIPTAADKDDPDKYATQLEVFVLLQFFRPNPGMPPTGQSFRVKIDKLDQFMVNGQRLGFPASGELPVSMSSYLLGFGHSEAAVNLVVPLMKGEHKYRAAGSEYPFVAQNFTIQKIPGQKKETMRFSGGTIEVTLSAGSGAEQTADTIVQTLKLNFPSASEWPRPQMKDATLDLPKKDSTGATIANGCRTYNDRMACFGAWSAARTAMALPKKWDRLMNKAQANFRDYRTILINSDDLVRSVHFDPDGPAGGDYRLLAATYDVPESWFRPHSKYSGSSALSRGAHSLREERWSLAGQPGVNPGNDTPITEILPTYPENNFPQTSRPSSMSTAGRLVKDLDYASSCVPWVPCGLNGAFLGNRSQSIPGDWENGIGILPDGPYIRNPLLAVASPKLDAISNYCSSYYTFGNYFEDDTATGVDAVAGLNFTPARQIASAVAFGALPTGVKSVKPWQTLLFTPHPAAGSNHPGLANPPDHLFLDFFWMPVAEPYAISEPFSTAGKVNMNYDILPFRYIKRRTPIQAVLKDSRITAIPPDLAKDTKPTEPTSDNYKGLVRCPSDFRYLVNLDPVEGTLRGFENRFKDGDIFRSPSEICDISLVPKALPGATYSTQAPSLPTYENMDGWWAKMTLTGDNAREAPYNDLYPRLTTKSNVFRVHLKVQTLKPSPNSGAASWTEGKDQVTGEYRGSFLLERFVDANDTALPDFASGNFPDETIDKYYRFRIIDRKQFTP